MRQKEEARRQTLGASPGIQIAKAMSGVLQSVLQACIVDNALVLGHRQWRKHTVCMETSWSSGGP